MAELILLIVLSIIIAAYLEKRSSIATIAHAILFIGLSFDFLFATDLRFIQEAMINICGKDFYYNIHEAMVEPAKFIGLSVGTFAIVEISILVVLPFVSIVIFIKKIREEFKKLRVNNPVIDTDSGFFSKKINPVKISLKNENKQYLVLSQFRI